VENTVQPGTPHKATWRMRIANWVPKAMNTHSEYLLLIEFSLQQWWQVRASLLRSAYFGSLDEICLSRTQ